MSGYNTRKNVFSIAKEMAETCDCDSCQGIAPMCETADCDGWVVGAITECTEVHCPCMQKNNDKK